MRGEPATLRRRATRSVHAERAQLGCRYTEPQWNQFRVFHRAQDLAHDRIAFAAVSGEARPTDRSARWLRDGNAAHAVAAARHGIDQLQGLEEMLQYVYLL
jgi:hypothetical protein